jgi:hypothetical protein
MRTLTANYPFEGAGLRLIDAEESTSHAEVAERIALWRRDEQTADSDDHPYAFVSCVSVTRMLCIAQELQHFTPSEEELQPVTPELPRPIDLTPPVLVNTEETLRQLVATLNEQKSFAFDVEVRYCEASSCLFNFILYSIIKCGHILVLRVCFK